MGFDPGASLPGLRVTAEGGRIAFRRTLPEEVPVAISYDGATQAVMMASPEDIADFAWGFSLTEGIVAGRDEVERFEVLHHPDGIEARFWLAPARRAALAARRRTMAGPVGCGLCGIDSLEQALRPVPAVAAPGLRLAAAEVASATARLRAAQRLYPRTGATHAAGFLLPGLGIIHCREDVGRHNALDKLLGALWRAGQPAAEGAIVLTSRVSIELVQKCAMAGCAWLIAASSPTARAVRLADAAGITLAACARDGAFDLFTHPDRIPAEASDVA